MKNKIKMRTNKIRLTESQLHRVIKESVNQILNEIGDTRRGQYMLGRLASRNQSNYAEQHGDRRGTHYLSANDNQDNGVTDYARKQSGHSGSAVSDAFNSGSQLDGKADWYGRDSVLPNGETRGDYAKNKYHYWKDIDNYYAQRGMNN